MKFEYTPEGSEPRHFEFEPDEMDEVEAEAIEAVGGEQWEAFGEWVNLIYKGGFRAWRAALWIQLRRDNPQLQFDQVKLKVRELQLQLDSSESEEEPGKGDGGSTAPDDSPTNSASPDSSIAT